MTGYYLGFDPFRDGKGCGVYVRHDVICDVVDIILPTTLWEEEALVSLSRIWSHDLEQAIIYSGVSI